MKKLNQRLRKLREKNHYTQKQVANATDISFDAYRGYEYQDVEPNIEYLIKIAEFYDVSVEYILGIQEDSGVSKYFDKGNNTPFPIRLRELRKKARLTQQQMATLINKNMRTYRRYEKGENFPSIEILITLADIFHVTIDDLIGRKAL